MDRVFTNDPEDWVSIPDLIKDSKKYLPNTQYYKIKIKGKMEQSKQ